MFFFDTLVRVRAGTRTDRGGNTIEDWSPGVAQRAVVDRLNIQPTFQNESDDATRTAVVTGWHVHSADGTRPDIRATDRLEWRGMTLSVDGEVAEWSDPLTGEPHHIEFTMTRATG